LYIDYGERRDFKTNRFALEYVIFVRVFFVLLAVLGKASDSGMRLLERRWLAWRDSYDGQARPRRRYPTFRLATNGMLPGRY
jgi:hypothetical protein